VPFVTIKNKQAAITRIPSRYYPKFWTSCQLFYIL